MTRELTTRAFLLALAVSGCREAPAETVTPLTSLGERRAPLAEEPPLVLVQPHAHRRDTSDDPPSSPSRNAGGGGGGASVDWTPRHEPRPSATQVEAFRLDLEAQMNERVDPTEDPCAQFLDMMRSTAEAGERPGEPTPDLPSREALRENCLALPQAYRRCMSPEYFREHLDECNAQMALMARRGEGRSDEARAQLDAIRAGRAPWPGQRAAARGPAPAQPSAPLREPSAGDEGR